MKLANALSKGPEQRSLSLQEWVNFFLQGNGFYPGYSPQQTLGSHKEEVDQTFDGYVQRAYKENGIVFACILARCMLFSEARFQFRRRRLGQPGSLFGSGALSMLEEPWPGGGTGDLLTRVIQDVDLGGNFFAAKKSGRLMRMRPDWVTIVLGSTRDHSVGFGDLEAEALGYIYTPGGPSSGKEPVHLLRDEVAHFAPIPDPLADFRGMSWLTPVLREIMADKLTTEHKGKYFEQGATPNLVVSFDATLQREAFEEWVALFKEKYEGASNAYKTMILGSGASAEVVGNDLKSVDFKAVQAAGENRIAIASGVPAILVGIAEGLESGTYSNYGQARRHFSDATIRPLWRGLCESLEVIVDVPAGAELWFDDRDISYLQQDQKDEAEIQFKQAEAMKRLVEAGYTPESARDAVLANDMSLLEHSGLVSVQLQKPGEGQQSSNGNGATAPAASS